MKSPLLLVLLLALATLAGDITLRTDQTVLNSNEQAVITAEFLVQKPLQQLPAFAAGDGYRARMVNKQQSRIHRSSYVNGKRTVLSGIQYKVYYHISFTKTGKIALPKLSFTSEGEQFSSNRISFSVGSGKSEPAISVKYIQAHRTLFVGQQSKLTVRVLVKSNANADLSNSGIQKLSQYIDTELGSKFTMESLITERLSLEDVVLNGIAYKKLDIPYLVTPIDTGVVTLGSTDFGYVESKRVQSRDPFDMGFGGFSSTRQVAKSIRTPRLVYTVKPLPSAPKGFTGALSRVALKGWVSADAVPAGEALTLKVRAQGYVSPTVLKTLTMPQIDNAETFTPETKVSVDTISSGVHSRKDFSYMIIPQEQGTLTIPAVKYTWFDTKNERFVTEQAGPWNITVGEGNGKRKAITRHLTQQQIATVGEDIQFIKLTRGEAMDLHPHRAKRMQWLLLAPWLVLVVLILVKLKLKFMPKNHAKQAQSKALSVALKELAAIDKAKSAASPVAVVESYISTRSGIQAGALRRDELLLALEGKGVSEANRTALATAMDSIEMARYAGEAKKHEAIDELIRLCKALEKELRR